MHLPCRLPGLYRWQRGYLRPVLVTEPLLLRVLSVRVPLSFLRDGVVLSVRVLLSFLRDGVVLSVRVLLSFLRDEVVLSVRFPRPVRVLVWGDVCGWRELPRLPLTSLLRSS